MNPIFRKRSKGPFWDPRRPSSILMKPFMPWLKTPLANGLRLFCRHQVTAIERGRDTWKITASGKAFETSWVINAAGLYADRIARLARMKVPEIIPRKGEEFILDKHADRLTRRVIFPVPQKHTKGILIIPTVDGNTMLGPTSTEIRDREDLSTTPAGRQFVIKTIHRLVPSIKGEDQIITSFAGLRPTTREDDFYLREDREGFFNIVGIQSPGLTAAPAIAEYVVNLLSEKRPLKPKTNPIIQRTAIPRFRHLSRAERNAIIREDPEFGEVVCRCELITKKEIKEAIRRGARTMDGIKFRTRSQMGRCHGAFCTMKIMAIMAEELGLPYEAITKRGRGSELVKKW